MRKNLYLGNGPDRLRFNMPLLHEYDCGDRLYMAWTGVVQKSSKEQVRPYTTIA